MYRKLHRGASEIGAISSINMSYMTANRYFYTHVHSALFAELTLVHTGGNTAAFQLSVHRSCARSNEVTGSKSSDKQALRLLSQAISQISRMSEELSPCLRRGCLRSRVLMERPQSSEWALLHLCTDVGAAH